MCPVRNVTYLLGCTIAPIHVAQLLSYLKIARLRLGLLVNFNVPELRSGIRPLINT